MILVDFEHHVLSMTLFCYWQPIGNKKGQPINAAKGQLMNCFNRLKPKPTKKLVVDLKKGDKFWNTWPNATPPISSLASTLG